MRHLKLIAVMVAALLVTAAAAPAQTAAGKALSKKLPTVKFDQIALTDAIDFFRDTSGANFTVDWKSIEEAGLGKDTPVSLQLKNVSMALALKKTLESAGPGLMTFYVDQNVLTITSMAKADTEMVTMVYSVGDLMHDIPNFRGPDLSLEGNADGQNGSRRSRGGNGGGGGGGGQQLFSGNGNNRDDEEKSKPKAERAQELIDIIQSTIRPDIWDVNGGKSSIRYLNGNLIITAPRTVQGGY